MISKNTDNVGGRWNHLDDVTVDIVGLGILVGIRFEGKVAVSDGDVPECMAVS